MSLKPDVFQTSIQAKLIQDISLKRLWVSFEIGLPHFIKDFMFESNQLTDFLLVRLIMFLNRKIKYVSMTFSKNYSSHGACRILRILLPTDPDALQEQINLVQLLALIF